MCQSLLIPFLESLLLAVRQLLLPFSGKFNIFVDQTAKSRTIMRVSLNCWDVNSAAALRLLSQLKLIVKMDGAVISGVHAQASHPKGSFGKADISIIDSALADDFSPPPLIRIMQAMGPLKLIVVFFSGPCTGWINMVCVPY